MLSLLRRFENGVLCSVWGFGGKGGSKNQIRPRIQIRERTINNMSDKTERENDISELLEALRDKNSIEELAGKLYSLIIKVDF